MTSKIKVVYIIGPTRSGSTIFSNILNEVDGYFNAGELIEYWDRGLKWPCSCGADTKNCGIWGKVFREMNLLEADYATVATFIKSHSHSTFVPKYMLKGNTGRKDKNWSGMLNAIGRLYQKVQNATGCEVIIDSSKNPAYAFLLGFIPVIDLYLIHLIRDSRAVAYSWQKKKMNLWTTNVVETSLVWMLRNSIAEMIGSRNKSRYLKIHYENFISKPREVFEAVFQFLSTTDKPSPIENDHFVRIGTNHGLCGNPVRFDSGLTRLQLDRRYARMKAVDRMIVTILTMPALLKYGYPIRIAD